MFVIGSGPAGIACASALVERGHAVTVLDGGLELEAETAAVVARLRASDVRDWTPADLAAVRSGTEASVSGVPVKRIFGSDFPFRDAERLLAIRRERTDAPLSLASGGLSHVWGSSMLPYRASDLRDWPISLAQLEPHYRAVSAFVPLSARRDDLESLFPLYADARAALRPSRQAAAFLADLERHRAALRSHGLRFGQARLAVQAESDGGGCRYCGLCMYGCPYDLIYRSTDTLPRLRASGRVEHLPNYVVRTVEERGERVAIHASHRTTGEARVFDASRVFLACGAVPTTRILLSSLNAHDHPLRLQDSQYYMFPLLRYRSAGAVTTESLHTLAQLFVEITDARISDYTVHLQLYSYNDLFERALRGLLRAAFPALGPALGALLGRLWIVQGYLHSAESPGITARLKRTGREDVLELEGEADDVARPRRRTLLRKLAEHRSRLRAWPVGALLKTGHPGKSAHLGGAFPMRREPGPFESDVLGRPHGFRRVHAVDATVFPSIPATTITLSVMANAHRIASSWEERS